MQTRTEINPQLVKQLREKTNAGMMDCKYALAEAGGDLEKAETILRKKGIATASRKASRATLSCSRWQCLSCAGWSRLFPDRRPLPPAHICSPSSRRWFFRGAV